MKKIVMSFAIPENLKNGLDKHCKKHKRSRSDFITNLIWRELGDWKQEKLHVKNCHTFHVFCDSGGIAAVDYGAEKKGVTPEQYIRHCISYTSYTEK